MALGRPLVHRLLPVVLGTLLVGILGSQREYCVVRERMLRRLVVDVVPPLPRMVRESQLRQQPHVYQEAVLPRQLGPLLQEARHLHG